MASDAREGWNDVILGDHVDLLTGYPFKSVEFSTSDDAVRLLKGSVVAPAALNWRGAVGLSRAGTEAFRKYELEIGDVVLAMDRPWIEAGLKYAWITADDLPSLLVQRVARLRGRRGLETSFLRYVIGGRDFTNYIAPIVTGVTVPHISPRQICSFRFVLPPQPIQRKISAVLSAYDDLIENNNRRIKILEEMAQRLYREWFVDFRYPGHEDVPLVESELGMIPKGWAIEPLKDVCKRVLDGDWIETKDQGGDDYRLLQVSNIGIGSFRETGNYRYISQSTFRRLRCSQVTEGLILVSRMPDPVGRAWYVDHLAEPAVTAVDVAILEPDSAAIDPRYCAFYLNTQRNLEYAAQRASGTTRLRITRRDLETFPILVPSTDTRVAFAKVLEDNGRQGLALTLQSHNLRNTRDLLLPRLISGEVDMSELEIAMPEVAA